MLLNVIEKGQTAIAERKPSERFFLILWLLGPFILLIERSPADIWLTSLSLAFVFRTIVYRDASWLKHLWVRAAFAFWGICLLSAVAYQLSANFVSEAFIWFRFPLFAMATAFWLGADKRLLYLMIFSTSLALLLMCGILIAEIAIEGFKPRLSWPFDDLVPGNYLAKVGLPVVVFASALFLSSNGRTSLLLGSYCVLILVMALLTGERINFLILLCAALLTIFIWEPSWKKRVAVFFAGAFVLLTIFTLSPSVLQRFVFDFLTALPLHPDSVYYQAMVPAWLIFEQFPILGIGPGNFRYFCADLVAPNLGAIGRTTATATKKLGKVGASTAKNVGKATKKLTTMLNKKVYKPLTKALDDAAKSQDFKSALKKIEKVVEDKSLDFSSKIKQDVVIAQRNVERLTQEDIQRIVQAVVLETDKLKSRG